MIKAIVGLGCKGVDVFQVQRELIAQKYLAEGQDDGEFGNRTFEALRRFQADNGLKPDGVAGPITKARLMPVHARKEIQRALESGEQIGPFHRAFVNTALSMLHVREEGGDNRGLWVERFQKAGGGSPGQAWCAYFLLFCSEEAAKLTGTPDPMDKFTGHVMTNAGLAKSRGWTRNKMEAVRGDVFWMQFGGGKGHTGIVLSYANGIYSTVEGNTNGAGSRDGDGVYLKDRKYTEIAGIYRLPVLV